MPLLHVFVKPSAKSNSFGFDAAGMLWIRVAAPATEGKANEASTLYLAEILGVKKSSVVLKKGQSSRNKGFEIDLSPEKLMERLAVLSRI